MDLGDSQTEEKRQKKKKKRRSLTILCLERNLTQNLTNGNN